MCTPLEKLREQDVVAVAALGEGDDDPMAGVAASVKELEGYGHVNGLHADWMRVARRPLAFAKLEPRSLTTRLVT